MTSKLPKTFFFAHLRTAVGRVLRQKLSGKKPYRASMHRQQWHAVCLDIIRASAICSEGIVARSPTCLVGMPCVVPEAARVHHPCQVAWGKRAGKDSRHLAHCQHHCCSICNRQQGPSDSSREYCHDCKGIFGAPLTQSLPYAVERPCRTICCRKPWSASSSLW